MNRNTQIVLLIGLAALGAWLWFSRSGSTLAKSAGEAVSSGVTFVENLFRGERNNNPGNIRISTAPWQGKIPVAQNTDGAFEQFDTVQNGIRALGKLMLTYSNLGFRTVRQIINRYAPPSENITGSYITAVAQGVGVAPDDAINVRDPATMFKLARAIIKHENGRVIYGDDVIRENVNRALT